jgi:hypothetical protein
LLQFDTFNHALSKYDQKMIPSSMCIRLKYEHLPRKQIKIFTQA